MKDKVLVGFGTYNAPGFLQHLVESFERYNPGYDCELHIVDNNSDDTKQINLLEKYSKKHFVHTRENLGRAQGSYDFLWQNNKDFKYYFFMHDDSAIMTDNWLKLAIDRIEDTSFESVLPESTRLLPVGKVGFQSYEWGDKQKYFRTGHPQMFRYIDWIAPVLGVEIPDHYQHINDDRYLIKNELLQKMGKIWNIEHFKQLELENSDTFNEIDEWFTEHLPNRTPFQPNDRYGWRYHAFQTVSEFLSDIAPMRYGYRTHNLVGDGYCQEELGWTKFWGLEHVNHYGSHNLFKRLSGLLAAPEEEIRKKFRDRTFLQICDNIVKKEND